MNVKDSITTVENNCGPGVTGGSGCVPTYETENFPSGHYILIYETSALYENFPYVLESYYILHTPIGYKNYAINQEYGLYNNSYVLYTQQSADEFFYSYKLASDKNYCDICINGYTETVVDCNSENWWGYNGE